MLSAALRRRVLAPTHSALRTGFAAHVVRHYASFPEHQVIKMPALSPTMQAGNIGAWQKKPGDSIAPGDVLVEIETDKAQMDFEFQEEGVIAKILKDAGEKDIPVGSPIAVLVEEGTDISAFEKFSIEDAGGDAAKPAAPKKEEKSESKSESASAPEPTPEPQQYQSQGRLQTALDRLPNISASAKRLAREKGISIDGLKGTGKNGQITEEDVKKAISSPALSSAPTRKSITKLSTMASKLTPLIRSAIRPVCRAARPQSRAAFSLTASRRSDTLMVHRNTEDNNPDIPFKFNEKNQTVIAEILKRYPPQYKKAAVMPLLDLGQRQHGFTSISVMNEVARLLEMPPMRVYEVASFYTMYNRTPVGKYFVQICTTTPCQLGGCGSDVIVKAIKEELGIEQGQTTADGLFTILEVECLGACVNAPMIQINDDYYEDLTPASVKDLLKSLRAQATASDPSTVNVPKPGPLSSRDTCENSAGQTSLNAEPWGTETTRADL